MIRCSGACWARSRARSGGLAGDLLGRVSEFIRGKRKRKGRAAEVGSRELIEVLRTFDEPYVEALAESMSAVTGARVTPQAMHRFLIGEVTLSNRLYKQARATSARVRLLLQDHTQYGHDARKLALDLYEGYGFRPEEILNPKVRLPNYLDDAALNGEMDALLARVQAARLKTDALRAAYLQALDQILDGAGQDAIDRALETAVQERYRYFANRIAQTELARAQNTEIARGLMADDEIQVVRWQLSATHPAPALCDVLAKSDRYGLGPGLYPKALAPLPPSHPFCRCGLVPRLFRSAAEASYNPAADAAYLRTLDPKIAARVAGSKAKRDEILMGANAEALWNKGRPEGYRIGRVGDVASRQSGAGGSRWEADAEYDAIRARRDDVDKIAANTGIKPANIQKVKDHVFNNVYLLDRYAEFGYAPVVARLQSDPAMARAWSRLIDGHHTAADLQLLRHEAAEAWYMRRHGPSYNAGHRAADARYPAPEFEEDE